MTSKMISKVEKRKKPCFFNKKVKTDLVSGPVIFVGLIILHRFSVAALKTQDKIESKSHKNDTKKYPKMTSK